MFRLPSGAITVEYDAKTQRAAFDRGYRCWGGVWWIERRYVSEWHDDTDDHKRVVVSTTLRPRLTGRRGKRRYVGEWQPFTRELRNAIIESGKVPRHEYEPGDDTDPGECNGEASH
jgi:hypothetical protein